MMTRIKDLKIGLVLTTICFFGLAYAGHIGIQGFPEFYWVYKIGKILSIIMGSIGIVACLIFLPMNFVKEEKDDIQNN